MKQRVRKWLHILLHRLRYPEQWEYESAAPYTLPEWNEFGRAGWQIFHIDQTTRPFCIYMKRRRR